LSSEKERQFLIDMAARWHQTAQERDGEEWLSDQNGRDWSRRASQDSGG
jgi:hypothetical protein